jgi:hypothetical protein
VRCRGIRIASAREDGTTELATDWRRQQISTASATRIRIIKSHRQSEFIPFDVSRFQVGHAYELGPRLAELLIVCRYAEPDDEREARGPSRQP